MQSKHFYTQADRADSIYQYVPFEVPIGTEAVTIGMRHDGVLSIIDLGLFDTIGFRGWSGSERNHVVVSSNKATPGYLPGPIRSGTWFVSIGLHKVDNEGVTVEVTIELGKPIFPKVVDRPPRPNRPPRRELPARRGFRWFPADFHTHSTHSDGKLSLDELASLAASRGLELLAVTDHNTTSHHAHLAETAKYVGINLIAGQEVTTDSGHANAFGEIGWIDYREATEKWLSETKNRGGLLSINHPLAAPCAWTRDIPRGISISEIWHSSWDQVGDEPIKWWNDHGRPIPIGGSDFHRLGSDGLPGDPTTWVEIKCEENEITQAQVLEALQAGRVAVSANPTAPVVIPIEDEIGVQGGEGCILTTPSSGKKIIRKDLETFAGEVGLYTLQDSSGKYQALGYIS
ncbi:MAG: PHP domain-containing protein [Streptomycetaceae bacterium]|nr:MAG: PHP domain-containing protein [Streptomycetaceae bacterium]